MHNFCQFPIMLTLTSAKKDAETPFVKYFFAIQVAVVNFDLMLSIKLGRWERCVSELLSDLF